MHTHDTSAVGHFLCLRPNATTELPFITSATVQFSSRAGWRGLSSRHVRTIGEVGELSENLRADGAAAGDVVGRDHVALHECGKLDAPVVENLRTQNPSAIDVLSSLYRISHGPRPFIMRAQVHCTVSIRSAPSRRYIDGTHVIDAHQLQVGTASFART